MEECPINKVHGKLSGLKKNQIKRLSNLYRRKLEPSMAVSLELARALGELSLELNKPVSVLVDRRGRVVTVALARLNLETGVPVAFGILTTDTIEQAIERAGTKAGNKGVEALLAAVETANLLRRIDLPEQEVA